MIEASPYYAFSKQWSDVYKHMHYNSMCMQSELAGNALCGLILEMLHCGRKKMC